MSTTVRQLSTTIFEVKCWMSTTIFRLIKVYYFQIIVILSGNIRTLNLLYKLTNEWWFEFFIQSLFVVEIVEIITQRERTDISLISLYSVWLNSKTSYVHL